MKNILINLLLILIVNFLPLFAQEKIFVPQISFDPETYVCFKTITELKIDGLLNEISWQKAKWGDLFANIEGKLKPQPQFQTKVKMVWDEHYFYIGAELEEPHLWATLQQRDTVIFQDNDFEIFFDPDGDSHFYFELEINALNTVWDLLLIKPYRDGGPAINSWDVDGLKSVVYLQGTLNNPTNIDSGWTVELAIPWEDLKEYARKCSPPSNGDYWRVNFSRVEWKTEVVNNEYQKLRDEAGNNLPEDNWVWSPQGLVNMHYPEMWGYVQFIDDTSFDTTKEFFIPEIEKIKWDLRKVYYVQKNYYADNERFADKNQLQAELIFLSEELKNLIRFYIRPKSFEIIYQEPNSNYLIMIDETGKISEFH